MRLIVFSSTCLLVVACDDRAADMSVGGTSTAASSTGTASSSASSASSSSSSTGAGGGSVSMGTVCFERHYDVEDPNDVYVDNVAVATYHEGAGFAGSNSWQLQPFGDQGNEDGAGWVGWFGDMPGECATMTTMFIGHMLYVSAGMAQKMVDHHNMGGKMFDVTMNDVFETRQTVTWGFVDDPGAQHAYGGVVGVVPALVKGGAGGQYVHQLGPRPFDLRNYVDEWIWCEYEFNAELGYTALWIKTQDGVFSGAPDQPLMRREVANSYDWTNPYYVEEVYAYADGPWRAGIIWGYWDNLDGVPFTTDDFVRVDDLVIRTGWIAPPF